MLGLLLSMYGAHPHATPTTSNHLCWLSWFKQPWNSAGLWSCFTWSQDSAGGTAPQSYGSRWRRSEGKGAGLAPHWLLSRCWQPCSHPSHNLHSNGRSSWSAHQQELWWCRASREQFHSASPRASGIDGTEATSYAVGSPIQTTPLCLHIPVQQSSSMCQEEGWERSSF